MSIGQSEANAAADAPTRIVSPTRRRRLGREIAQTLVLTGLVFVIVRVTIGNFRVQGDSMQPTLQNNEYVLVDKAEYWFRAPQRGDVVVFRAVPADNPDRDFIKRIIAQPGDTVEIRRGHVYVNGRSLHERYISSPSIAAFARRRVPRNSYFVLGDNRNNSFDSSRWPKTPWLDRKYIIGRAWVSYWPLNQLTSLEIRIHKQ